MKTNRPYVHIYSDGSADNVRHTPGGWGAVLIMGDRLRGVYGTHPAATNNYMEAYAAFKALTFLRAPCRVHLYTDSQYVVFGFRAVLRGRLLGTNTEVWKRVDTLLVEKGHIVTVQHVDGHSTTRYNELADELASWGSKNGQKGAFYAHEVEQASPEARLIEKVKRRIDLRKARAEGSFARVA